MFLCNKKSAGNAGTLNYIMVLMAGLEPARTFGPRDFKSLASAYFATSA